MNEKQLAVGILCYLLVLSVAAVILTISDKLRAKNHKWRIAESSLLLVALFGGALAEYITMRCIRHKTQHKKFTVGLPLILLLHAAIIGVWLYFRFFH